MSMLRVSKIVPPKRQIIKDISLSFFPGAKIGLLGLNGAGKSTVLKIMAGVEKEYDGEVQWQPNLNIGYLAQDYGFGPALVYISAVALIGALSYILLVGDVKRVG